MGKKIGDDEIKKECPSCGLGVSLDSKVCQFCGWDFKEEDEWILQIEKLERELMMEKQKFEPGSVDQKIEASLHTPTPRQSEPSGPTKEEPLPAKEVTPVRRVKKKEAPGPEAAAPEPSPPARPQEPEEAPVVSETIEVENVHIRTVRGASEPEQPPEQAQARRVRAVKPVPAEQPAAAPDQAKEPGEPKSRKVRVVRKVR